MADFLAGAGGAFSGLAEGLRMLHMFKMAEEETLRRRQEFEHNVSQSQQLADERATERADNMRRQQAMYLAQQNVYAPSLEAASDLFKGPAIGDTYQGPQIQTPQMPTSLGAMSQAAGQQPIVGQSVKDSLTRAAGAVERSQRQGMHDTKIQAIAQRSREAANRAQAFQRAQPVEDFPELTAQPAQLWDPSGAAARDDAIDLRRTTGYLMTLRDQVDDARQRAAEARRIASEVEPDPLTGQFPGTNDVMQQRARLRYQEFSNRAAQAAIEEKQASDFYRSEAQRLFGAAPQQSGKPTTGAPANPEPAPAGAATPGTSQGIVDTQTKYDRLRQGFTAKDGTVYPPMDAAAIRATYSIGPNIKAW